LGDLPLANPSLKSSAFFHPPVIKRNLQQLPIRARNEALTEIIHREK
jgi:hypothetical protein